jgi:glycosyltransferase involved in cell wall biosynthesis
MTPAVESHHVIRAYEVMSAWGADVVHDHTLIGPLHARGGAIPVATTNHGPFESELADLYRVVSTDVAVIAISRHQASTARDTRIAAVIHHGIDVDAVPVGSGEGGFALCLGRMSPDKGIDVAARVARRAGVPLKIAAKLAEPAELDYFDTAVRPLLGGDVEYVGEVGGPAKYELLGAATCLLNPLRWAEPFGMVMIEALACGTPVVATTLGSVGEVIEDGRTGLLRVDEAELATAVIDVAELDRGACRASVSERFSLSRMVAGHQRVFEHLHGRRPRHAVSGRTEPSPHSEDVTRLHQPGASRDLQARVPTQRATSQDVPASVGD